MSSPASPAETRAYIVERLVGDIGEPGPILDTARSLAERALPVIRQGFADFLSSPIEINIGTVELVRFAQARPESAATHAMTVASSPSSPDALILLMDPAAIALVVGVLFGADADAPPLVVERPLSPTEVEVSGMAFEAVANAINGSGSRAFEFRMPLPGAITGEELGNLVIRDGPAVRVVFALGKAGQGGTLSLTMPQRVLLKHRSDGATFVGGAAAPESEWREKFNEEVMRSAVTLEATMPLTTVTLGQLAGIQAGQVIEFQEAAQSQAKLSARGKTLFVCEFGKLGQNYTVRIRHPYDAGKDLMDGLIPA